jgi:hypothetical protein
LILDMVAFRITYARYGDVRDDLLQMDHGGVLVKVREVTDLELDTPATRSSSKLPTAGFRWRQGVVSPVTAWRRRCRPTSCRSCASRPVAILNERQHERRCDIAACHHNRSRR